MIEIEQEIPQLITGLMDAWNSHNVEQVTKFYTQDYEGVDVSQAGPQIGIEGLRQSVTLYLSAFPDLQFTTVQTTVQGNQISLAWRSLGTHLGTLMNIPPTGRVVSVYGVSLLTLEHHKVHRALYVWDVAGLLRSIGLLPEL